MGSSVPPVVHVAVGVVSDGRGRVLIARRPDTAHQGGLWEFPGGKVESGERVLDALRRELTEELGIEVASSEPLLRIPHDYGDKRVLLDVHRVTAFDGEARPLEGQPLRWVPPGQLRDYRFPEANRPIITALSLPSTCLVTPAVADESAFLSGIRTALRADIRFLQLRRHDLESSELVRLGREVAALCRQAGALLAVNAGPDVAAVLESDACHLSATTAAACPAGERPVARGVWLGASCHGPGEIDHALSLDADYLFVSPVLPTRSHPGAAPLGWAGLERLIRDVPVPVYALGGVGRDDLPDARRCGAHGVAGIRAMWPVNR